MFESNFSWYMKMAFRFIFILLLFIIISFVMYIDFLGLFTTLGEIRPITLWIGIIGNSLLWILIIYSAYNMKDNDENIDINVSTYIIYFSLIIMMFGFSNIIVLRKISLFFGIFISGCFLITTYYYCVLGIIKRYKFEYKIRSIIKIVNK